jgi:hypothetical protein
MKKLLILLTLPLLLLSSCTLSFSNIDTHGTASDLVDEQLTADPDVSPTITVPVSAVPAAPSLPGLTPSK